MTDDAALARYYDLDLLDDPGDLPLYQALAARTGGPILELAVGSGRIAVPLAASGYDVTGVDIDPSMLARAQAAWMAQPARGSTEPSGARDGRARPSARTPTGSARRARRAPSARSGHGTLRLLEADLTLLRLEERFGLAILALNTLLLLEQPERQVAALRTLAAHLRPDGLAVVDIWLPGPEDLALYDGRLLLEWLREDPVTGDRVAKLASARYDSATATVTLTQLFDAAASDGGSLHRVSRTDRLRLIGVHELLTMTRDAGLVPEGLAGDHQMSPFGSGDERAIVVARLV